MHFLALLSLAVITSQSPVASKVTRGVDDEYNYLTGPCEIYRDSNQGSKDSWLPKCKTNGYYALLQCNSGQCWCSDANGNKLTQPRTGNADCNKPCFRKRSLDTVQYWDCDSEGYFKPKQCLMTVCWCVDKYGNEKSSLSMGFPTENINCN